MFAMAEVRSRTPKFNDLLQRCAERHPMYPEYNDELCPEIAATYDGTETPQQIGVSVNVLFPRLLGLPSKVKITSNSSIDSLVEEYYQLERKRALDAVRAEVAGWGFSASEIFPETVQSPSIH